jgi:hypothetical protein
VRALVLGWHVTFYGHVHKITDDTACSLLHRGDVECLDCQDDCAGECVSSNATLAYTLEQLSKGSLGCIVYPLIFGDLINAYQSWKCSHPECVLMVLWAKFFKDLWKSFYMRVVTWSSDISSHVNAESIIATHTFWVYLVCFLCTLTLNIWQCHWTKEAEKGVHLANSSTSSRKGTEEPVTERWLLAWKTGEIVKDGKSDWQAGHGSKHRAQLVYLRDKDLWAVFTSSFPHKGP